MRAHRERSLRTYAARLQCGTVVAYESASHVPVTGEVVPCRRHGFCAVERSDRSDGRGAGAREPRRPRRSESELLEFLTNRPVASVHMLRSHRFTLRLVVSAQAAGLVDVDLATGLVRLPREDPSF